MKTSNFSTLYNDLSPIKKALFDRIVKAHQKKYGFMSQLEVNGLIYSIYSNSPAYLKLAR